MSSITGLKRGSFTSIDNSGEFRLDTNLDTGTAGEVITSGGPNQPATWGPNAVAVPNALTMGANVNLTSGNPSWDGSVAETLNSIDTDTTYSAGNGIDLTGTTFSTDNDGITINNSGAGNTNQVLKVPSDLTINGIVYNGSLATNFTLPTAPIPNASLANSSITLGTTSISLGAIAVIIDFLELSNCQGITMAANIDCDCNDIDNVKDLTYCAGGSALTGGGGAGDETTGTYLDLSSNTNLFPTLYPNSVSPYLVFTSYDPAVSANQALTTSAVQLFSGGLSSSFVALGANVEVELKILSYGGTSNRWLYLTILDGAGTTEWSASTGTGGGYGTGTRPTERLVHYRDETDSDYVSMSWVLTGLTPGNTYIVNPGAKTNLTSNYIYAGGSFPACVFRVIQL